MSGNFKSFGVNVHLLTHDYTIVFGFLRIHSELMVIFDSKKFLLTYALRRGKRCDYTLMYCSISYSIDVISFLFESFLTTLKYKIY